MTTLACPAEPRRPWARHPAWAGHAGTCGCRPRGYRRPRTGSSAAPAARRTPPSDPVLRSQVVGADTLGADPPSMLATCTPGAVQAVPAVHGPFAGGGDEFRRIAPAVAPR